VSQQVFNNHVALFRVRPTDRSGSDLELSLREARSADLKPVRRAVRAAK
jgi:hypothetical protein